MAHDVFVSHSSKDKTIADAVCASLESKGLRCWIAPRDILPSSDWGESIIRALEGSRLMVLIFSGHANQSVQITREVERAVSKAIPIIPFRIEDVRPARSLEYFLSSPHWLDAITPPLEKHLDYLAQISRHIIDGGAGPAPPPPTPKSWWSKRSVLFIGSALAVFGMALLLRPGGQDNVEGGIRPVEESFTGKWMAVETKLRVPGAESPTPPVSYNGIGLLEMVDAALRAGNSTGGMEINALGQYTFELAAKDHGSVTASGNVAAIDEAFIKADPIPDNVQFTFSSAALKTPFITKCHWVSRIDPKQPVPGASVGEIQFAMESPSFQQIWLGTPGIRAENPSLPRFIVGDWRAAYANAGTPWGSRTLRVTAQGDFTFHVRWNESGIFDAANGRWKRNPSVGLPSEGTYIFEEPDIVITADAHGTVKWKRVAG